MKVTAIATRVDEGWARSHTTSDMLDLIRWQSDQMVDAQGAGKPLIITILQESDAT